MTDPSNSLPPGTRVIHLGTQERGTVTATSTDTVGVSERQIERDMQPEDKNRQMSGFAERDDDIIDALPREVRDSIQDLSDDELVAECHRRGLPGTLAELADEANRQGVQPSELIERLDGSYDFAKAANILTEEGLL